MSTLASHQREGPFKILHPGLYIFKSLLQPYSTEVSDLVNYTYLVIVL